MNSEELTGHVEGPGQRISGRENGAGKAPKEIMDLACLRNGIKFFVVGAW